MSRSLISILLVEDTLPLAQLYEEFLRESGYDVVTVETGLGALARLKNKAPDAVVLDLLLPDINGLEVLQQARKLYPTLPIVVVTVNNSVDVAVEAMRRGAFDFIVKPFSAPRLIVTLRNALEHKALSTEVAEWRQAVGQECFHNFIGRSPVMQAVYRTLDAVASSKASVFLLGENGTGKEMAAQVLHQASPRRDKPFIAINCAAIPKDLMESSLFGHVKGSFTGAVCDYAGAAKTANGGTLFLDEICELPIGMQTKLLRFVQTGEVMPVGGMRAEFVDVRIIAATNRNPQEEVAARRFREDLFYRLHVVPIEMPPLRERGEDILMLAAHFLARFNAEENRNFTTLSPEVAALFRRYEWPGNVRQMENVLRNVIVLNEGPIVLESMLPRDLKRFAKEGENAIPAANQNLTRPIALSADNTIKPLWHTEKEAILGALNHVGQDIPRAAVLLQVSPSTLYRKLQAWRDSAAPAAAV
jgi:two-component system repressor protein LuxO